MGFYAANFIYDSIISSEYGLHISNISDSDTNFNGADVELITQSIYRKPKVYLLGVQQKPVLTLPVTITVPQELSASESSVISKWLFGQTSYKKLQILQYDMLDVYFNCIFVNPQIIKIGNIIRGYNAIVMCDSPYAWEFPKRISYTYSQEWYEINEDIIINNSSDNPDYTYPTVTFEINMFGGGISITNKTDNSRVFTFENLLPEERITVDNDLQLITSSTGENRLSNFTNYKWMRYTPGINNINISGNVSFVSFVNNFGKKIV